MCGGSASKGYSDFHCSGPLDSCFHYDYRYDRGCHCAVCSRAPGRETVSGSEIRSADDSKGWAFSIEGCVLIPFLFFICRRGFADWKSAHHRASVPILLFVGRRESQRRSRFDKRLVLRLSTSSESHYSARTSARGQASRPHSSTFLRATPPFPRSCHNTDPSPPDNHTRPAAR
jgi:hypothetical protein